MSPVTTFGLRSRVRSAGLACTHIRHVAHLDIGHLLARVRSVDDLAVEPFLIGLYVWKVALHRVAAPAGIVVTIAAVAANASPVTRDAALFRILSIAVILPRVRPHQPRLIDLVSNRLAMVWRFGFRLVGPVR